MATKEEIAAFEQFKFYVGEKVQIRLDRKIGFVIERCVVETANGIGRWYEVISAGQQSARFREFELEGEI